MDYSLQKKTQEGYQVIDFSICMSFAKFSSWARILEDAFYTDVIFVQKPA